MPRRASRPRRAFRCPAALRTCSKALAGATVFASVLDVHGVLELRHGLVATVQASAPTYLRLQRHRWPRPRSVCFLTVGLWRGFSGGRPAKKRAAPIVAVATTSAVATPHCESRTRQPYRRFQSPRTLTASGRDPAGGLRVEGFAIVSPCSLSLYYASNGRWPRAIQKHGR